MRQLGDDDATRPAWDDAGPEPDHETLRWQDEQVLEAVKRASRESAEEAYERAMTSPIGEDEPDSAGG